MLVGERALYYPGTMTDNAAGTHAKVIGSSPSSSPSVWTHTVPGADTVAPLACRIGDPRQAEVRAAQATPRR